MAGGSVAGDVQRSLMHLILNQQRSTMETNQAIQTSHFVEPKEKMLEVVEYPNSAG
jgi:hypothetical protein